MTTEVVYKGTKELWTQKKKGSLLDYKVEKRKMASTRKAAKVIEERRG